ncbi:MAG TPA: DNA replication/repair protein RecF [Firmicutes bacterium]|nr:DNA replication/repair protein RecF [Bacillota bacterium]
MLVTRLSFENFRNLQAGGIQPVPGVNIVYGSNAQGKTNLLEAFWFFTGGRSFRGSKDAETVAFGADKAALHMEFTAAGREQEAEITISRRRHAVLNGVPQTAASHLAGHFCAVVFSPAHLSLVKDGPEGRRRFLDAAYCQLRPGYIRVLGGYHRTLSQRNALLKDLRAGYGDKRLLDIWDERLAEAGAQVFAARTAYIRRLAGPAREIYAGLSGGREEFSLRYDSTVGPEDATPSQARERLYERLQTSHAADLGAGFTTAGPHRDDLAVAISGLSARTYASQGQQRSAVLALKLAEASVLREVTGEQPVALLDDVMSELDISRQDYILNHIDGWQVFLTCCDPSAVLRLSAGRIFHVEAGRITQETVRGPDG